MNEERTQQKYFKNILGAWIPKVIHRIGETG
jgi:hypothetical protein